MHRYSRGIAFAVMGSTPEAENELKEFRIASRAVPQSFVMHNNSCQNLLKIADAMLEGEIEYRLGIFYYCCLFLNFM